MILLGFLEFKFRLQRRSHINNLKRNYIKKKTNNHGSGKTNISLTLSEAFVVLVIEGYNIILEIIIISSY